MATPEQAFADLLARDPGRPFVTFYDGESGERTELSVRSLANWVAKTHFLLIDELGLGAGDRAVIALPQHWISVPAVLGCLTAGLTLLDAAETDAAVAFVAPATIDAAVGAPDVFAVAPESPAVGFGGATPAGAADYVVAVRPQADKWATVRFGGTDSTPAIGAATRAEVVEHARARADELGLGPGARVLSTRDWTSSDDWVDTLLAPLAVGGSVVYARNFADPAAVERIVAQERTTARL